MFARSHIVKGAAGISLYCVLLGVIAEAQLVSGLRMQESSRDFRVLATLDAKPLQGASVNLYQGGILRLSLVTDMKGIAEVRNVAPGDYEVNSSFIGIEVSPLELVIRDEETSAPLVIDFTSALGRGCGPVLRESGNARQVASFQGALIDVSGAVIPSGIVRVVKEREPQQLVLQTKSDSEGRFTGTLAVGSYIAYVFANGFRTGIVPFDIVETGSGPLKVTLQVGQCTEDGGPAPGLVEVLPSPLPVSYCPTEQVAPNLELSYPTHVVGTMRDETTAPFEKWKIAVRRFETEDDIVELRTVTTDERGQFDLGTLPPGKYRLIGSSSRAFAQPYKLECGDRRECNLEITLKGNPSDLPYAACPVK